MLMTGLISKSRSRIARAHRSGISARATARRAALLLSMAVVAFAGVLNAPFTATADGGDLAIYREAAGTDVITTSDFDHDWDTTVKEDIASFSLDVDNKSIKLKAGHYLVLYGARFDDTGGNNRSEIQTQLVLSGTDVPIGWSQGYIRRSNNADEAFTSGGGIIKVVTDDDPLLLRSFRTDSNASAGVQREPNVAGIQLLKLYDGWSILRLHRSTTQVGPINTTFLDVAYDQQDEIDAAVFSHTAGSGDITLKEAGHYLVFANTFGSTPGGTDRSLIGQKLTLDGGNIDGTDTTIYIRGSNGTNEGAVSIGTIIETTAADQVLNVEVNRPDGTVAWTINQDGTGATVPRTAITIAKLGENAEYIRLDDSGNDNMNPAVLTSMGWDTEDEIDDSVFTHPAPSQADSTIGVDVNDKYLFLTSLYAQTAGVTRAVYNQGWSTNGGALIPYGQTGRFNRRSGANDVGNWSGIIFDSLSAGDYVEVETQAIGNSGTMAADVKGVQGIRLKPPVPVLTQDSYRWYDNVDAVQPTTALAAENTAAANVESGDVVRIRMNVQDSVVPLAAGTSFKLQFSTSTSGPWTDVGAIGSGAAWRGLDNPTPADGATISSTLLSGSNVAETYEEANNSVGTPNVIGVGLKGEWDWVVQNNVADINTTYYFRMANIDDSALDAYSNYPQLTTVGSVTITESAGSTDVTEGGATDTYDIVLDAKPTSTVTITLTPDAEVNVVPNPLTFTTGDWSSPQTVTVTAVDDPDVEGAHFGTVTHSASGGGYDSVSIANVVANVTDNDAPPGVTITESGGSTDVTEVGATDTYDVVLDAIPTGDVTITISPDSQVTVGPNPLTFNTSTWNTAQTVTVTAVDDATVEGPHTGTITHAATGGGYDPVSISNVVANITDRPPTVTVTETAASTDVTEGGATDTYDIVLDAKPTSTVTITISPDTEVGVGPNPLTFTTTTWNVAQTVTVTAVNDLVVEGGHSGTITHSASGGGYDGVSIASVVATITDNDTPSVTVTETGGSTDVTEGGATDTYDVVLDLEPSGTVTITVSPDTQVDVSATSLLFTTGNWSSAQTITVTAVDDTAFEGPHFGIVTHSASGGDYDGVTISSVVANITDDDVGGGPLQVFSISDAEIRENQANNNYGTLATTRVRSRNNNRDRRTFVQFDVSAIPSGSSVTAATMTLCATSVPGVTRSYEVHRVTSGWVETVLTWNNQPGVAASATYTTTTPASPACMNWTVTADVQAWVDGTANNGWRVKDTVEGSATNYNTTYRSRENTGSPSDRPKLVVTYAAVSITPSNEGADSPDAVVSYNHTITNTGTDSDTMDVTTVSTELWTVSLFESDGLTPLTDTDGDTTPDTGTLASASSTDIVVKVTVGWSALTDVTTVTAASSIAPAVTNNASDTTTAPPTITINLGDPTLALGLPDPGCEDNPDATTVGEFTVYNGTTGNEGCTYVWDPLVVTVESNKPWTGTVEGADGTPTSELRVAFGSFRYDLAAAATSYSQCGSDTTLTTVPVLWESSGPEGDDQGYTHHHCVLLDWDDDDGTIDSTITYTVSQ